MDEFWQNLDRSALGFYAVPLDVLVLAHYAESDYARVTGRSLLAQRSHIVGGNYETQIEKDMVYAIKGGVNKFVLAAELHHWWSVYHPEFMALYATREGYADVFELSKQKLALVINNHELQEYFAVGIWDIEKARHARSHNLDPNIAVAVV